ncbi:hypothetical protein GCM10022243_34460 [Saccharothrix violaceirubra]|uniref:ADP-ribosylglycohydrolase n=1 Tax=Saccharothrix violaceirubra TaxID=413306 RepID=A0A7W7WWY7_9PSEU|nr:hypothetical protein [Saccharothrix violaceirubra]MBB4966497.1 ADP-ribosylglycohydrolase [Saccharothrix violaceirubra]
MPSARSRSRSGSRLAISTTSFRAFRVTAGQGGDVDTTCAIVGGVLGARTAPPDEWSRRCEELPDWVRP